ncbi:hypothetical protein [Streptomyces scopuliridis]|uniref:hypothetical protein n=1 Tax=Streptomyces scopuliridis TaxID=452529 RepID=UPI003685C5CF
MRQIAPRFVDAAHTEIYARRSQAVAVHFSAAGLGAFLDWSGDHSVKARLFLMVVRYAELLKALNSKETLSE